MLKTTISYIIAGPCAAESEAQVLATAHGIAQCQAHYPNYTYIYRAGIWKPRSSPNTFQGIGAEGLTWLQEVQQTYHLPVATEVATPEQVKQATEAGIDYLWIGARTSANPIAVQTIADAVDGTKIKGVMVKNPVNEDAALWLGNIARLEQAGVAVMAIHRGCNHRPCWAMAYQLLQARPDIPILIDPSHLSGKASAIAQLCTQANRLGYSGWMVETHIAPQEALSDAQQQITPEELEGLVNRGVGESVNRGSEDLDWQRAMIDEVDDDLWQHLTKRMEISKRIGAWKKERQIPALQPSRYQEILQKRIVWGSEHGLDKETVEQIMEAIHKQSVRIQS